MTLPAAHTSIFSIASRPSLAPAVHRFTGDEYYRMVEAGLFHEERVELLDGEIITMSPQNTLHASTVYRLVRTLERLIGTITGVRGQFSIVLSDRSEPEPDVAVCAPDPYDYSQAHPRADQVFLVVEVADTSLTYDCTRKAQAYAESGIPEYWIVNLLDHQVEVLTDPSGQGYRQQRQALAGDVLSLPGGNSVAVGDILP